MTKRIPSKSRAEAAAPAASPDRGRRPSALLDTRVIYCGDCLEQLRKLPNACVDLIYIDPPFNSNRNYEVFWSETKEKRAFEDRHASTQAYIDYMRPRCVELARVLKKTGSFYYHCDWHASHYVKVMLDQIFGEGRFRNEITWKRSHAHSDTKQGMAQYGRVCDYLFFYTGGEKWVWNATYTPYDAEYLESEYRHKSPHGKHYKETDVTAAKPGGDTEYEWRVKRKVGTGEDWLADLDDEWKSPVKGVEYLAVRPYDKRYWAYSKQNLVEFWKKGKLIHRETGMPRLMQFAEEMPGIPLQDLWTDIPPISALAAERLGYPTQKPLALLERIIKSSSNPNDIVLDAFCGCGTALVAAENLGRQWIGIDISPTACRVMAKRLRDVCKLPQSEEIWRKDNRRAFTVRELPYSVKQLRTMPPFEFENWAVIALGGIPNKVQVGDMGIDGRIFPVGTKPYDATTKKGETASMFAGDWFPIQVKQMDKVGRPDIDQFAHAMDREERQRGFFVAFGFTSDAEAEAARCFKTDKRIIKLITVQEILDEQHVQKM